MKLPDLDMDHIVIDAIIVIIMLIGMRLSYGYWPWQARYHRRPTRHEIREHAMRELVAAAHIEEDANFNSSPNFPRQTGFNFEPLPLAKGVDEPDPTQPPPFPIFPAGSAGYKPPLVVETRNGKEDHFDRGYNDNGKDEEPKRSQQEGVAHAQDDDNGKEPQQKRPDNAS
jgi:hypothetical protein